MTISGCPKPVSSSPQSSSKFGPRPRSPAPTASLVPGSTHSSTDTALKATPRSNPDHGDRNSHQPRPTPRPLRSSGRSASNSQQRDATQVPRRSAGISEHHHKIRVHPATIYRHLVRAGLVTAEPKKRPRSSYIRFVADQPNECWQSDFTHYRLAGGTDTEILSWLDDHSRYALRVTAHRRVTGPIVLSAFRAAGAEHGYPTSTLMDNGMVFTARYAGGRGGRNSFETELARLGITQKNSRPNHPTTCAKVERFQQTLKKWLRSQPQPETIHELQTLLDQFVVIYNQHRPHRSLARRATPATIYTTRPKVTPTGRDNPHYRVRHHRRRHPPRRRSTPPHRHRTNPRPNPRHPPRRGPLRPRRQRHHRRTPPRPHHRHHTRLPTHRRTQRPHPTQKETAQTQLRVQAVLHVSRHDNGGGGGI